MNLLKQIESKDMRNNQMCIYFLGQSGYVLRLKALTIYIDPYLTDYIENPLGLNEKKMYRSYPSPIDPKSILNCNAIICTHSHVDHMDPWTINNINTDFQLFVSIGAYEKSEIKIPQSRLTFLQPETTFNLGEINIIPFSAAHYELIDEFGRPDCLSILIQWRGINLFFWGDGIRYDEQYELLSGYNFDYFFGPINGRDKKREKEEEHERRAAQLNEELRRQQKMRHRGLANKQLDLQEKVMNLNRAMAASILKKESQWIAAASGWIAVSQRKIDVKQQEDKDAANQAKKRAKKR